MNNVIALKAFLPIASKQNMIPLKKGPTPSIPSIERFTYDAEKDDISILVVDNSAPLYWRPITGTREPLNFQLKNILHAENMLNHPLSMKDIPFLKGVRAAGVQGVDEIITAIHTYGFIEFFSP